MGGEGRGEGGLEEKLGDGGGYKEPGEMGFLGVDSNDADVPCGEYLPKIGIHPPSLLPLYPLPSIYLFLSYFAFPSSSSSSSFTLFVFDYFLKLFTFFVFFFF